uniref:Candidate secreted effector n=1 Tax=Meloidogyne incognita TaxID=6306 RepID=A0A914MTX7_MELIC
MWRNLRCCASTSCCGCCPTTAPTTNSSGILSTTAPTSTTNPSTYCPSPNAITYSSCCPLSSSSRSNSNSMYSSIWPFSCCLC